MSETNGERHGDPLALLHQVRRLLADVSGAMPGVQDPAALGSVADVATDAAMMANELARNATAQRRKVAEALRLDAQVEATVDNLFAVTSYFAWNTHRFSEAELRAHLDEFFVFDSGGKRMSDEDFSVLFGMVREGIAEETGVEWVQSGFKDDSRDEIRWAITIPEGATIRALEGDISETSAPPKPLTPEELRRREVAGVLGDLLVGGIKRTHLRDLLLRRGVEDPDAFLREAVAVGVASTVNRGGHKFYVSADEVAQVAPAKPNVDASGNEDQQPLDPAFTDEETEIASKVFAALSKIPVNERNDGIKMADLAARVGGGKAQTKAVISRLHMRGMIDRRTVRTQSQGNVVRIFFLEGAELTIRQLKKPHLS